MEHEIVGEESHYGHPGSRVGFISTIIDDIVLYEHDAGCRIAAKVDVGLVISFVKCLATTSRHLLACVSSKQVPALESPLRENLLSLEERLTRHYR